MFRSLLTACLCLLLLVPDARAAGGARLLNMEKGEALEETVLKLAFSSRPRHRLEISGQRIDLFLFDTSIGPAFVPSTQIGGSVAKVEMVEKITGLLVSFQMTGIPRGARVESGAGPELAVHVLWEAGSGKVLPQVAARRVGGTGSGDNSVRARTEAGSRYAGDWAGFYRDFETPIEWRPPVAYTIPDLPEPGAGVATVLREIWRRTAAGGWEDGGRLLRQLAANRFGQADRQFFLLMSGVFMLRDGKYNGVSEMYRRFREEFPSSPYLNRFTVMAACGVARGGDPYAAVTMIAPLLPKVGEGGKTREPVAELLYAEVQLATGRPRKALEVLILLNGSGGSGFSRAVTLRTAAARAAATGQFREALAGYRQWLAQAGKDETMDHYSLARYGESLEAQGEFKAARPVYLQLADNPQEPDGRALALFAAARCGRKLGETAAALDECVAVRRRHPGSEGALRAWLLELDLAMSGGDRELARKRGGEYAAIAATARERALREEAAFKHALAVLLGGDNPKGVELLRSFRRDFAAGELRREAEVLLMQRLGPLMAELQQAGKSYEAMLLVEQNRDILSNYTLPPEFAARVAKVFQDMGMYRRAGDIYDYLIKHAEKKADEERYYLPLTEVLYAEGRHDELFETVRRYQARFPGGKSLSALLLIQARLSLDLERSDEAAATLAPVKEESPELLALRSRLAAAQAVRGGGEAGSGSTAGGKGGGAETPWTRLLRAERLLREGQAEPALVLFEQLVADEALADQARYRCGQIHLEKGERQRGVNFLRELVEKGKEKYWQELAREMLILAGKG